MSADAKALQTRLRSLEDKFNEQTSTHHQEMQRLNDKMDELKKLAQLLEDENNKLDTVGRSAGASTHYMRRIEWTIDKYSTKEAELIKGQSLWSPHFRAVGLESLQFEFFPKGHKKTTFDGFCSLFLWAPGGTTIKYQLWVGSFLRAPEIDEYKTRVGHGHSNFCPIAPEVNKEKDSLTVGVDILEVSSVENITGRGLTLVRTSLDAMMQRESAVVQNAKVKKVVWKINNISERLQQFPKGTSMWSQLFTAQGIREILLEFYPNGSAHTTKDGFCAFYIRCSMKVSIYVTLIVGKVTKGPISTTFTDATGKGLPDFCLVQDEINRADDTLEVGIELENKTEGKTLIIDS
jgi:hypothetical protein